MAYKKKPQNKTEKKVVAEKAPSIDWDSLPATVEVIAFKHKHLEEGKVYSITKAQAKILVEVKAVKLK
jgi:hypothetical protein